jgi:DNA-binding response OmpR family regulator
MTDEKRRTPSDRRRAPRGGRRAGDQPGLHPVVLVAEPYEGVRTQCVRYLRLFNFQAEEAVDAAQALAVSQRLRPAVVVADLALVTAAGGQLAFGLAGDGRTEHVPVIGLADLEEEAAAAGRLPQIAGVLVKPFRLAALLQEMRRLLREPQASEDVAGV